MKNSKKVTDCVSKALEIKLSNMPENTVRSLVAIGAIELRPDVKEFFTWSSGIKSPIYCDNRKAYSFVLARDFIVSAFIRKMESLGLLENGVPSESLVIAGVATGAIGWGAIIAHELGIPFVYVRSKPKGYGKSNQIEGHLSEDSHVVFIEDLFSTGRSSVVAVRQVMDTGAWVSHCISIFTYGFDSVAKKFNELPQKCQHDSLATFESMLAVGGLKPDQKEYLLEWVKNPEKFKK